MRFMSGLSAIKKAFSDKPGIIRPLVVAVLVLTWYMTFFACILSGGKYFYISNLLAHFVFLKSKVLWSMIMLAILCVLLATPFSEKLFRVVLIGFLIDAVLLLFSSEIGFGIHWNANGATTVNDVIVADIFTSLAKERPFCFLYGSFVGEDTFETCMHGYYIFAIIPSVAITIGGFTVPWREYLKKRGARK